MKTMYAGSTITMELTLKGADGLPIDLDSLSDVIVLLRYEQRSSGTVAKFKKVSSGSVLAWSTDDPTSGIIQLEVPAANTVDLPEGKVLVDMKAVFSDGTKVVTTVGDAEFFMKRNNLADD